MRGGAPDTDGPLPCPAPERQAGASSGAVPLPTEALRPGTILYIACLCLLWGGNMVAMKIGLQGVPPVAAAGFRFLLASASVLLLAVVRRAPLNVPRNLWGHLFALGGLFVAQHIAFNVGLNLTSASRSVVFMYTQPVFTVLLAHALIPGERLTAARLGGVLLCLAGLIAVFAERLVSGAAWTLLGDALVTLAGLGWALQSVYMKRLLAYSDPFMLTLYQMVIACPCFFLINRIAEPTLVYAIDARILLAFLYQGCLIAGLTFVAWTSLIRRHQVGQISAFIFLTPIFGVLLSWLLLGDPITRGLVAGVALVAAGIALVNRTG